MSRSLNLVLNRVSWLLVELGQSEVCYFGSALVHEDVGSLDIAMADPLPPQIGQPLIDVSDNGRKLLFSEYFLGSPIFEIPVSTQFGDNVAIPLAHECLIKP